MVWIQRLSLDAVLVGLVWFFAVGGRDFVRAIVWGLIVWLIYAADRLLDIRWQERMPPTDRHRWHHRNRFLLGPLWLVLALVAALCTFQTMPLEEWVLGWVLLFLVGGYFYGIQRMRKGIQRLLLKRVSVALLFTLGLGLMSGTWKYPGDYDRLGLFALGAFLNLMWIAANERKWLLLPLNKDSARLFADVVLLLAGVVLILV